SRLRRASRAPRDARGLGRRRRPPRAPRGRARAAARAPRRRARARDRGRGAVRGARGGARGGGAGRGARDAPRVRARGAAGRRRRGWTHLGRSPERASGRMKRRCKSRIKRMQPITLTPGGGFLLERTGSATILRAEGLSDEQLLMKQTADDFMKREVEPRVAEIEDKRPGLLKELLRKAGEIGLLGHDIPEAYGGLGGDKTSSSLIFESMSRVGSWAVTFGAHTGLGTMPGGLFCAPEQRGRRPPRLAPGESIAAHVVTRPAGAR